MSDPNRYVIIDDTDPRIQYEGSDWKLTTAGTTEAWGIFGPTYNHTLHETFKDGSLSFRFNGTRIGLYGTIDTNNNQPKPSWICSIDGKGTGRVDADAGQHTNHWVLCEQDVDGLVEHVVTFNVTVPDGATFWFDEIMVAPTQDVLEGESMMIQDTDSSITYQPGANWNQTDGITYDTDIPGSNMTFKFSGTAATFYSVLQPNLKGSTAQYIVDGGPPTSFTIPSHTDVNRLFNQPLFTASSLSPTDHTLVVTFTGQRNDTPLSLDYFIITLPPKTGQPTPSGSGALSAPSQSGSSKKSSAGPIAGGVVGGIVGLALLGFLIFFFLRRRRQTLSSPESGVVPFAGQREPKPLAPVGPQAGPLSPGTTSADGESTFNPYSTEASGAVRKQQEALATFNSQPRDVRHMDSGLRLGEPSGSGAVRDIPPEYTEH